MASIVATFDSHTIESVDGCATAIDSFNTVVAGYVNAKAALAGGNAGSPGIPGVGASGTSTSPPGELRPLFMLGTSLVKFDDMLSGGIGATRGNQFPDTPSGGVGPTGNNKFPDTSSGGPGSNDVGFPGTPSGGPGPGPTGPGSSNVGGG